MRREHTRLIGWTYDDETQEIRTPSGRIVSLHDVARMLADHQDCRIDFTGKWSGWRLRQHYLILPGGSMRRGCIAEHVLRHVIRTNDSERREISRRQLPLF